MSSKPLEHSAIARRLHASNLRTVNEMVSQDLSKSGVAPNLELVRLPVKNYMPPEGVPFYPQAYVAIPLQGASATVVSITVPKGRNGIITRIANVFIGGGFEEGVGAITWQLMLDFRNTINPIVAPYFNNIVASLGAVSNPAHLPGGIAVKENQIVALRVSNAAAPGGVVPAGQLIGGLLGGYFYPKELEPAFFGL